MTSKTASFEQNDIVARLVALFSDEWLNDCLRRTKEDTYANILRALPNKGGVCFLHIGVRLMQDYRIKERLRLTDPEKAYYELITTSDARFAIFGDRTATAYATVVRSIYGSGAKTTLFDGGYVAISVPLLLYDVCKFDVIVHLRTGESGSETESKYTYSLEHGPRIVITTKIVFDQSENEMLYLGHNDDNIVANIIATHDYHVVLAMRSCGRYIVYDNSQIKEFSYYILQCQEKK